MSIFSIVAGKKFEMLEGIPGPSPSFPVGNALAFLKAEWAGRQPWELCADYARQYGGLTLIWLGPFTPALILNDGKLTADVLVHDWEKFYKDAPSEALEPIVTDKSPFVLNGPAWRQQREGSPFTQDWFEDWVRQRMPRVYDYVVKRTGELASEGQVDLNDTLLRLTFDAFSEALLGQQLNDATYRDFMTLARTGDCRIQSKLPLVPPILPSFYSARSRWFASFEMLVKQVRAKPDPSAGDLINTVISQKLPMSDERLAIALANVYYGGAFSVSSAVSANLYLLHNHPDYAEAVRRELAGKEVWDTAQLDNDGELECSIRESLRYLPPVPLYFRNADKNEDISFAGHTLPANTLIFITNWYVQRESDHWDEPLAFNPGRWQDGGIARNPIGSEHFYPFGMGPRMCMGLPFALPTIKTMLAALYRSSKPATSGTWQQQFFFGVMMPKSVKIRFGAV